MRVSGAEPCLYNAIPNGVIPGKHVWWVMESASKWSLGTMDSA